MINFVEYSTAIADLLEKKLFWKVHSSFEKVSNIIDEKDNILALHLKDIPKVPMSIVVEQLPTTREFFLEDVLDFTDFVWWNSKISTSATSSKEISQYKSRILRDWLNSKEKKGILKLTLKTPIAGEVLDNFTNLLALWKKEETTDFDLLFKRTMGFGPGLTPSSDDVLCGILGAIYGTMTIHNKREYTKKLASLISPLGFKYTTTLSANFIKHYCMGNGSQILLDLVNTLYSGTQKDWIAQIEEVDKWGGSSGRDLLYGFSLGLEGALETIDY